MNIKQCEEVVDLFWLQTKIKGKLQILGRRER